MPTAPIETWYIVVVVVRRGDRFLLIQERKHGQTWYFPAGRAKSGESLEEAACRETLEEAGIAVELTGIHRILHTPLPSGGARLLVIFSGQPKGPAIPKSVPDDESLQAAWVSLEEMDRLPLRSPEVRTISRAIVSGAKAYPLGLLASERSPFF